MDVKEHLGQFLSDKKELSDVQISTVEQLTAIFSLLNRKTLIAVVKYLSYFDPPGSNVLQRSIDFILDNSDIINDIEIEVICNGAYNIIDNKMDGVKKTEDSKDIGGSNSKDGDIGVRDNCLNKNTDSSVTTFSNLPDSPEFITDKLNSSIDLVDSKHGKDSDEINNRQNDRSIPCIDLESLPALDFPVRRSQSSIDIHSKRYTDEVDSSNKKNTPVKSLSDSNMDGKAFSHSYKNSGTSASFTASSVPQNLSSINRSVLSRPISNLPVKPQTNNIQLAVSQEVYLQWKIEYKKKLAEKYSKSLKLLRSLTPNPEAERQLRQAYEDKLRLVETGQKLPQHLIQPQTVPGQNISIPNSSSHLKNDKRDHLTPQKKSSGNKTFTPMAKLSGSSFNSSPSTIPGVNSLIPQLPDILSPTSNKVSNTSFSEFVNRIVSENKLNTSIRSKADDINDTSIGSKNSSRTVSSITSIENKDNVVTVVNTITISPTNNSVLFSEANDITVPKTNSSSICDKTNLALARVKKTSIIDNILTSKGNTTVNNRTAEKLTYLNNNTKPITPSSASVSSSNSKPVLSQTSPIGTTPSVKRLLPSTTAITVTSNCLTQSTVSPLRTNSAQIIKPSSFASSTYTPIRANSTDTPLSVKSAPYRLNKRSTPSATITSGATPGSSKTQPLLLNKDIPVCLSWTPAGALPLTNTPPAKSITPTLRHQVLATRQSFTPTSVSAVGSALSFTNTPSKRVFTSPNTAGTTSASRFVTSASNYTQTINQGTYSTVTNQNTSYTSTSTLSSISTSSSIPPTPTTSTISMSSKITPRSEVLQLFPDADPKYVDELLSMFTGETAINNVCSTLIDNPSYPRVNRPQVIVISPSPDKNNEVGKVDYYTAYLTKDSSCPYFREGLDMLGCDFRMMSIRDITAVMNHYKNYYAPAHRALSLAFQSAMQKSTDPMKKIESVEVKLMKNDKVDKVRHCRLLKNRRTSYRNSSKPSQEFKKEIDFVAFMIAKEEVDADAEMARKLNEAQYTEAGDNIECGCCYGEQPFEDMVQCYDGHLFCKSCLQSYVREAVFGSGKLDLRCMTEGCDSNFPESQLQRCLEKDVLEKYQERVREENLNLADLEDLVRCPNCEYAAIMDVGDKVFRCQNIHCLKETCRFCKEEWKDHIGIPCAELEKKDEAALRKEYEEKMTAAKVRSCHKCKSQFMKEDGCNKMTCRCGATMCYVCRKPSIHYDHFCQHPRDPGSNCKKCKACSLWSNPEEDDQRAVTEIQKEAQKIRREKGFLDDKLIGGTTSEPPAKKARTK